MYVVMRSYKLIPPSYKSNISLEETLFRRRSRRRFINAPILLKELSQLLWAAYGINESRRNTLAVRPRLKTSPSAGGCYPLEVYTVIENVDQVESGFYKYIASNHSIEEWLSGELRKDLSSAAYNQEFIRDAAINIVFTAIYERNTRRYGQRGRDRYVCMDLGHAGQNVYLQAEALGLGTCAVGAFNDERVHSVLQLPYEEVPLYIMPVGRYK